MDMSVLAKTHVVDGRTRSLSMDHPGCGFNGSNSTFYLSFGLGATYLDLAAAALKKLPYYSLLSPLN